MNDIESIEKILSGNSYEFRYIVEKYNQIIFRTCLGYVHNKEEAEDITQEVFISAYKSLDKFKRNSAFSTWLYRIAVNTSLNHLRGKQGNILKRFLKESFSADNRPEYHNIKSDDLAPDEKFIESEKQELIRKALSKLPENQKTAIVLSKYNDLSQKDIAEILNKTEGAVEALIQRAKENLRKYLQEK